MKGFTLRKGSTEIALEETPATWSDWVRLMSLAARKAR